MLSYYSSSFSQMCYTVVQLVETNSGLAAQTSLYQLVNTENI